MREVSTTAILKSLEGDYILRAGEHCRFIGFLKQRVGANNPDKTKRNNPIIGLTILTGFKFDDDDEWKGGDIYDPEVARLTVLICT